MASVKVLFSVFVLLLALLLTACGELLPGNTQAQPTPSVSTAPLQTGQAAASTPSAGASATLKLPSVTPTPSMQTLPPAATVSSTLVPDPHLDWEDLRNAAYPNEHAPGGVAHLQGGVLEPSGAAVYFQLSHSRLFADLDGDSAEDALVFLLVDVGGPGTLFYLYPVLNRDGKPAPGQGYLLGEGVFLRSLTVQDGEIFLLLDAIGSPDYACCPKDSQQLVLRLEGSGLALQEALDLPDRTVGGRPPALPMRLQLSPGAATLEITGEIGFNQIDSYRFAAEAGQVLSVDLHSPAGDLVFSIFGEDGEQMLASFLDGTTAWNGRLPTRQDYLVQVVALGGETGYHLTLKLDEPSPADGSGDTPPPGWMLRDDERKVVYLTFDDGPSPTWTPRILTVLARYSAQATFFVLADEVQKNPLTTEAILQAGHAIASHSATHQTFEGITRRGFQREVGALHTLLEGREADCLRPPYGAIDAYTRVYAAEMGYRTVLWDIDPQDWRRPGVTAIVQQALSGLAPGDILLFHDGGGDRSQTVLALEIILRQLSSEGYEFEAVCR